MGNSSIFGQSDKASHSVEYRSKSSDTFQEGKLRLQGLLRKVFTSESSLEKELSDDLLAAFVQFGVR